MVNRRTILSGTVSSLMSISFIVDPVSARINSDNPDDNEFRKETVEAIKKVPGKGPEFDNAGKEIPSKADRYSDQEKNSFETPIEPTDFIEEARS